MKSSTKINTEREKNKQTKKVNLWNATVVFQQKNVRITTTKMKFYCWNRMCDKKYQNKQRPYDFFF